MFWSISRFVAFGFYWQMRKYDSCQKVDREYGNCTLGFLHFIGIAICTCLEDDVRLPSRILTSLAENLWIRQRNGGEFPSSLCSPQSMIHSTVKYLCLFPFSSPQRCCSHAQISQMLSRCPLLHCSTSSPSHALPWRCNFPSHWPTHQPVREQWESPFPIGKWWKRSNRWPNPSCLVWSKFRLVHWRLVW